MKQVIILKFLYVSQHDINRPLKKTLKSPLFFTQAPSSIPFCTSNFLYHDMKNTYFEPIFIQKIELKPLEDKVLNKYGKMHRAFLQKHNPMMLDDLVLTQQLFLHLYEVQEIAKKIMEVIMVGLPEKNLALDKEADAMACLRHMNMLRERAKKMVYI